MVIHAASIEDRLVAVLRLMKLASCRMDSLVRSVPGRKRRQRRRYQLLWTPSGSWIHHHHRRQQQPEVPIDLIDGREDRLVAVLRLMKLASCRMDSLVRSVPGRKRRQRRRHQLLWTPSGSWIHHHHRQPVAPIVVLRVVLIEDRLVAVLRLMKLASCRMDSLVRGVPGRRRRRLLQLLMRSLEYWL